MVKKKNKGKAKSKSKAVTYSCGLCDKQDDLQMVSCDKCDKWYHYSCGNFDEKKYKKKDPWFCPSCKSKNDEFEQTATNCSICNQVDTAEMVECHHCEIRYHIKCVDFDSYQGKDPWKCQHCMEQLRTLLNVSPQNDQGLTPVKSVRDQRDEYDRDRNLYYRRSHERDPNYMSSFQTYSIRSQYTNMSRYNAEIELEYLNEERNLQEKWAKEKRKLHEEHVERERRERQEKERRDLDEQIEAERREKEFLERKYKLLRQERNFGQTPSGSVRSQYTNKWVNEQRTYKNSEKDFDGGGSMTSFSRRINELAKFDTPDVRDISKSQVRKENLTTNLKSMGAVVDPVTEVLTSSTRDKIQQPEKLKTEKAELQSKSNEFGIKNAVTDGQDPITKRQIAARHVIGKQLAEFHGDPLQWTEWYNTFETDTLTCGLSNGENLSRLKKSLKGKAREAVKHRLLTPSAVPGIIETLKLLFGRPELIVKKLIESINDVPAPKAEKLETLIEYAVAIKNISAEIEGAKMHYHLVNPTLIEDIIVKLPMQLKLEWGRFMATKDKVTVVTLADWLYEQAEIACKVTSTTIFSEKKSSQQRPIVINAHEAEQSNNRLQGKAGNGKIKVPQSRYQCKICNQGCLVLERCSMFLKMSLNQRWEAVKKNKICPNCLKLHRNDCNKVKQCEDIRCTHKHHTLLHRGYLKKSEPTTDFTSQQVKPKTNEETVKVNNNYHHVSMPNVFYRIVPVTLYHHEIIVKTFAYLDEGSSGTLMQEDLAEELNLKGSQERLCLLWTSNVHRVEQNSRRMEVKISGQSEFSERYLIKGVRTVNELGLPIQSINAELLKSRFPYLRGADIIDYEKQQPRILIGLPHAFLCTQLKVIEGDENQPIASKSRIGWSIHGPTQGDHISYQQNLNLHRIVVCQQLCEPDEELHRIVKEYFTLENFGVKVNNKMNVNSKEDQRALEILEKNTIRKDGKYQTALLWKYDSFRMEDSYQMAERRLRCFEKSKPNLIKAMNDNIMDYVTKGYARKLTPDELSVKREKVGYLPIFSVSYPKKPDKFRMVFDAAAKVNGTSLNDLLLKGPDQLNALPDVLRRFRENPVGVCGDIIEMFHRIEVCDEDKHVQRFLWRNGDDSKSPDVYVLEVMSFGAKCSPSTAQYVKNKNAEKFTNELPRAVEAIVKNTYVDDMIDGAKSDEEAIQLITEVKRIHEYGGFQISKFLSNSSEVLKALEVTQDDVMKGFSMEPNQNTERVLGMFWNTKTDCFTFSLKYTKINGDVVRGKRYPTKREILQTLMSIFDPLGLLAQFLIRLKILLQEIWRSNLKWDDQITSDIQKEAWDEWFKVLPDVENVQIPRYYRITSKSTLELHMFVDASADAYSAVAYLRIETDQQVHCVLLGSKARVAPIRYISIPRMELQSAVLGTRLLLNIEEAQTFKVKRTFIWTDSKTVMSWIRSDHKKYHQFVAHRIGEILENSDHFMWRWLPTKENVADEATKWTKPISFEQTCRWYSGPDFLTKSEDQWPTETTTIEKNTEVEMKIRCLYVGEMMVRLIQPERFSNWNRMVRSLAYVFRYIRILRARIKKETSVGGMINQEDIRKAKNIILRQAQYEGYPDEMIVLAYNKKLPLIPRQIVKASSLYKWSPYLDDDNLLRVKGRIDVAPNVPLNTKRPIILPKSNRITSLLVDCFHRIYQHRNNETVVNEIKQQFYIPKIRIMVKKAKKICQKCKVERIRPQAPQMGDLPTGRLAIGFRPYTHTGIDFFGPMEIIDLRRRRKRWGVIFTCLTTRAIYIEIAHKMDTESCMLCIGNFTKRHGFPTDIYTDNGTNLVAVDNELTRAVALLNLQTMADKFTSDKTNWHFNPPHAKHQGGCWERLIRSIKISLNEIWPSREPDDEQLRNLLMEIEFIVNSRPLTFVPVDHEEAEALTPNHFLIGSSGGSKLLLPMDESGRPDLRSKWKENQRLADMFWKRFVKEYLPTLTRKTKWFEKVEPLQVGDIVLMMEEPNVPRNWYPRAKVIEAIMGSNQQVRKLRVQRWDNKIFIRSAHQLAKLDVEPYHEVSQVVEPSESESTELDKEIIHTPKPEDEKGRNFAKKV